MGLTEWKARYGEIYSVTFRGVDYIFRALTLQEMNALIALDKSSSVEMEDFIVSSAILQPENAIDVAPAGVISSLSDEIRAISGFGSVQQSRFVLDDKRMRMGELTNLAKAYIIATMQSYREEDLDNLNFNQLMAKVALAEKIIELQQAIMSGQSVTLEVIDPEEENRKERQRQEKERRKYERMKTMGKFKDSDETGPVIKPNLDPRDPILQKLKNS